VQEFCQLLCTKILTDNVSFLNLLNS